MKADTQDRNSPPSVDYDDGPEEEPSAAEGPAPALDSDAAVAEAEEELHEMMQAAGEDSSGADQMKEPLRPRRVLRALKSGFAIMRDDVAQGEWDFAHAGVPSWSFRVRKAPGQVGPVRDKMNIHGFSENGPMEREEAERGSRMAIQAAQIYEMQVKSCVARKVPPLATLENPPGSAVSGGMWDLPEVDQCLQRTSGTKIPYDNCAFQVKERERVARAGVWAGRLENIQKIQKVCRCPAWIKHRSVGGMTVGAKACDYPSGLVELLQQKLWGSGNALSILSGGVIKWRQDPTR
eukprot:s1943_g6.t1